MFSVTTTKKQERRVCQAFRDPVRYKCGHCERGNVLWVNPSGSWVQASQCKVCRARVELTFELRPYKKVP
jgi:hypothetical protein